mgnify:CR=1 FL=1
MVRVASIVCCSVLQVVADQMGRREGMKQVWVVFETCKATLILLCKRSCQGKIGYV